MRYRRRGGSSGVSGGATGSPGSWGKEAMGFLGSRSLGPRLWLVKKVCFAKAVDVLVDEEFLDLLVADRTGDHGGGGLARANIWSAVYG